VVPTLCLQFVCSVCTSPSKVSIGLRPINYQ